MGVVVCAWCKKVIKYSPDLDDHEVSHGICEHCKGIMMKELDNIKLSNQEIGG